MAQPPSDALVVFGVTGDLAFKQIFPALQAMVRHGHLNVPVLGVARSGWSLDQLRDRARHFFSEAYARDLLSAGWRIDRLTSGPQVLYGEPSAAITVHATELA